MHRYNQVPFIVSDFSIEIEVQYCEEIIYFIPANLYHNTSKQKAVAAIKSNEIGDIQKNQTTLLEMINF